MTIDRAKLMNDLQDFLEGDTATANAAAARIDARVKAVDQPVKKFPLEDPNYTPKYPPVNGIVPAIVSRWGKNSQLRWFKRFSKITDKGFTLSHDNDFSVFWCDSEYHVGPCCGSCIGEFEDGFGVMMDGYCCCQDRSK